MKRLIIYFALAFFFTFAIIEVKADQRYNSYNYFYSSLAPYGEWIELDVDLIVWRPNSVHSLWKPYSIGRWSWTKYGWYWDSYEPFGWATYHYGRWYYDDYYGWIWIPDNVWGPSWVEWRYDDDYIGWAPLPPYAHFRIGIGIYFSINWHSHHSYWNFVTYKRFHSHRLHYYILDNSRSYRIFSHTKYRNNYYSDRDRMINGGIDRSYIERRGGYRIAERDIQDVDSFDKYSKTRSSTGERIYNYRPSDREVEKVRDNTAVEIKRSERRTSLETDKIVINNRDNTRRAIQSEKNISRNDNSNKDFEREKIEKRDIIRSDTNRDPQMIEKRGDTQRDLESERRKIESRTERNYEFKREDESEKRPKLERKSIPERTPEIERRIESERRVESRRESNYERPNQNRAESERRNESRNENKNREKDSRSSSDRRR